MHNAAPRVLGCEGKCEGVMNLESMLPKVNRGGSRPCCKQALASLANTNPHSCRYARIFLDGLIR